MALAVDSLMTCGPVYNGSHRHELYDLKPEVLQWLEEYVSPVESVNDFRVTIFSCLNFYKSEKWYIGTTPQGDMSGLSLIHFTDPTHELQFKLTWL